MADVTGVPNRSLSLPCILFSSGVYHFNVVKLKLIQRVEIRSFTVFEIPKERYVIVMCIAIQLNAMYNMIFMYYKSF